MQVNKYYYNTKLESYNNYNTIIIVNSNNINNIILTLPKNMFTPLVFRTN